MAFSVHFALMALGLIALACHSNAHSSSQPQHLRSLSSKVEKDYYLWSSEEIRNKLVEWHSLYPEFVQVTTSQQAFDLPAAGNANDCPYDSGTGCYNYILTIQDYTMHPENSPSSNKLPEVLWSGCVHGNERVGPTATMEAASLLLQAASCESKPNLAKKKKSDAKAWESELAQARLCRLQLKSQGISDRQRQWLARLVSTRRIVILPTANALGYYRNVREEETVDPNRDFPFDVVDPTKCMQTIAGRTLNEVFRNHMIQLSLTFHGGMEVIGYEWGAPTYLNYASPDDTAQHDIAQAYSQFGGGWDESTPYKYGTMNDLVYYVRGGMEDWAYAASWDPERVITCKPTQYGGYHATKTQYNNSTLRVFNMLVETSNTKAPNHHLGTSAGVLTRDPPQNGHVSRNVRLALLAAEMVEPYLSIVSVNDLTLSDDIVPLATNVEDYTTCQRTKGVMISQNADTVHIEWTVGGALEIDETSLLYGKWSDVSKDAIQCMTQPSDVSKLSNLKTAIGQKTGGTGYFSKEGPHPPPTESQTSTSTTDPVIGPVFSATLDVSSFSIHDEIVVLAKARVDQSWLLQPADAETKPKLPPQAHVVNARTNPDWHHESAGKVIQGRLDWYTTIPLTIVIGDFTDSVGKQSGRQVGTIELSNRFGHSTGETKGGIAPSSNSGNHDLTWKHLLGLFVVLAIGGITCAVCLHSKQQARHSRIVNELLEEEEEVFAGSKRYTDSVDDESSGLYSDDEDEEHDENGENGNHDGDLELRPID